jgi:hypothetical protein
MVVWFQVGKNDNQFAICIWSECVPSLERCKKRRILNAHVSLGIPWTDAEKKMVRRLYLVLGKPPTEIVEYLPGRSRNAVIGFIHRTGLYKEAMMPRNEDKSQAGYDGALSQRLNNKSAGNSKHFNVLGPATARAEPHVPKNDPVPDPFHIPLVELTAKTCRWPYGDGQFTFCGHEVEHGPYCKPHTRFATTRSFW